MRAIQTFPDYSPFAGFFNLLDDTRFAGVPRQASYDLKQVGENEYDLTLAVLGFSQDELAIELQDDVLAVRGKAKDSDEAGYTQDFARQFRLGADVKIGKAKLANGLLTIRLTHTIPPAKKAQRIKIATT